MLALPLGQTALNKETRPLVGGPRRSKETNPWGGCASVSKDRWLLQAIQILEL